MAVSKSLALRRFFKRWGVSIFFPTFYGTLIFADYNHTRKWKLSQLKLKQTEVILN
ncbi:uncharacterized protein LOC124359856 [Homalodisca vitripennis]|uniref:uncharacterized protein LOC124359856 n=1 Tax=Homalodisca vitripennis TaxID=197043 RepID=UPI001EEC4D86|nr:uncharacterized protein LOC124359856 [Homalodisca vitripennis]XP_046668916.1 uncharacterized protein LOC124359856 [Homalodisca vitripennis]XP_046668925.1 uncharacterized protein LOC124359856 [Homalodisca vitripennis]